MWPAVPIVVPHGDAEAVVDALESGHARDATTPTRLGHRHEIHHLLDARVQECHAAHDAGLMCNKHGQARQEVLRAVLRVLLGAVVRDLADNVQHGVAQGVPRRHARIVPPNRAGERTVVGMWQRDVRHDGHLGVLRRGCEEAAHGVRGPADSGARPRLRFPFPSGAKDGGPKGVFERERGGRACGVGWDWELVCGV